MISVVIPALNEEKLIARCLQSLRNQDYQGEYELIVVDNGSTDATVNVARKFGAMVVSCPQQGVFHARQAGAAVAGGEIIAQADADTIYPPDWLTRIEGYFGSRPDAVALTGNFVYQDPPWWARAEYFARNTVNALAGVFLKRPLFISGATFSFRRKAFLEVKGYRENSPCADQYDLAARLAPAGRVLFDKRLTVLTSARRVSKPALTIAGEVVVDLLSFFSYLIKGRLPAGQASPPVRVKKLRWTRTSLRVLPLVLLISFLAFGYFVPTSQAFGKVYYKGQRSPKTVALTFDDGPNEPYTTEILAMLSRYHVKATFFVIGKNVEHYPETAKRILAEGHVLGNHSYSHNANHAITNSGCGDIKRAEKAIFDVVGVEPRLYRPPHGKKSPWELACAKRNGLITVEWSDSANELHKEIFFGKPTPESVAQEILREAAPGKIILLHDGYGTEHNCQRCDKSLTVRALPIIIEKLQAQGYRFVTVPELLAQPGYERLPGETIQ